MKNERAKLEAQPRVINGRQVKKIRREGLLPANLYGKKLKSVSLQLPLKDFMKVYQQVGESGLVDLKINGETHPILIHNVQLHPVSDLPLHADFHEVSLTEKTTAMVPIDLVGESPAVEQKIGILIQPTSEIEVEALPQDLPESLSLDITSLANVGDTLTVGDIKAGAAIELKANPEDVVVKIDELAEEEVLPAPEETAEGEAPAESEKAGQESEAPEETAEGEAPAESEKQE